MSTSVSSPRPTTGATPSCVAPTKAAESAPAQPQIQPLKADTFVGVDAPISLANEAAPPSVSALQIFKDIPLGTPWAALSAEKRTTLLKLVQGENDAFDGS